MLSFVAKGIFQIERETVRLPIITFIIIIAMPISH